jgi:DNA-binding MurR/RpiR family transcriptional regulator
MSDDEDTIERRIRRQYGSLPPAERRLADLILGFPGEVATYSATELAGLAGVSKAAATRLFQRLGYQSYNDVRQRLRDAGRWGSPLYRHDEERAIGGESAVLAHLSRDSENLKRTYEALDARKLAEALEAMVSARRVFVMGFRNSYLLALYMQRQLLMLRDGVGLIPAPGQTLAEYLSEVREGDFLLVVGLRRRVPQLGKAMEIARSAGAKILYVTDPSAGRTLGLADWSFVCEVESSSIFDSYVAAQSLLNFMASTALNHDLAKSYERLRRVEDLHEELGELDTTARQRRLREPEAT